jgi:hypothetical protein
MAMITAIEKFFALHLGGRFQDEIREHIQERLDHITVDVDSVKI